MSQRKQILIWLVLHTFSIDFLATYLVFVIVHYSGEICICHYDIVQFSRDMVASHLMISLLEAIFYYYIAT